MFAFFLTVFLDIVLFIGLCREQYSYYSIDYSVKSIMEVEYGE